jgi:hypothetical protein|tara:strand:+ start:1830 stop:1991 length:162 start_codon:yes stop_codon:yes gene_type:complete
MEEEEKRLRLAVIAGAAKAAEYLEKNPSDLPQEAVKHVSENTPEILSKIDEDL